MDVKDESKIQDFHFQQWFGGIAPDPNILSPTEPQDQILLTTADPDDHEDQMWNDPQDLFESTPEREQPDNTLGLYFILFYFIAIAYFRCCSCPASGPTSPTSPSV